MIKSAGSGVDLEQIPYECKEFDLGNDSADDSEKIMEDSDSELTPDQVANAKNANEQGVGSVPVVDLSEQLRQLDEVTAPKRGRPKKKGTAAAKSTTKKLTKAQQKKLEKAEAKLALAQVAKAIHATTAATVTTRRSKRLTPSSSQVQQVVPEPAPVQPSTSTPNTSAMQIDDDVVIELDSIPGGVENNKGNKKGKKSRASARKSPRSSHRRRRNFSGTNAAATADANIEVIDLIKSPPLLLPGVVSINAALRDSVEH